jgi:hypothetical protein
LSPWKFIRITYIVPLPHGAFGGQQGTECPQEERPAKRQLLRNYLPDGVDVPSVKRASGRVLGASIEQALGLGRHTETGDEQENRLPRRVKLEPKPGAPEDAGQPDWEAEWVKFGHPEDLSTHADFLLIHTEVPEVADAEAFLSTNRFSRESFLNRVLKGVGVDRVLYGDGALGVGAKTAADSLSLRFPIMTVTWAVPTGPGALPSPLLMAHHQQWSAWLKWGFLFATHQPADRRIPADTKERAERGVLKRRAAWDVRVEPFGISVLSNASPRDIGWDQLHSLRAEVNPFVQLALLAYVQHVELERFSRELARTSYGEDQDLDAQLTALNAFGRKFHRFRNAVWFDSVPNEGFWTAYLQLLHERLGSTSKIGQLWKDYEDWATYLRNRAAEANEIRSKDAAERKEANEKLIKKYSAVAAVAGLAFGLLTLLVEPGHSDAILWGWVCGALSLAGFTSIYTWDKFATRKGVANKVKRPFASAAEPVQSPAVREPLERAPTRGQAAESESVSPATVGR